MMERQSPQVKWPFNGAAQRLARVHTVAPSAIQSRGQFHPSPFSLFVSVHLLSPPLHPFLLNSAIIAELMKALRVS